MRAVVIYEHGDLDVLQMADVPRPEVGPDEVLIRVRACALNHLDLWVRRGLPGLKLEMPHIMGSDLAGVVAEVGEDVIGVQVGQRVTVNPGLSCGRCEYCVAGQDSLCVEFGVLGEHVPGGCAEYARVPARNVLPIPDGFPFVEAAAAPLVFLTAWRALVTQAGLRAGEDILILGASGGVASAAIQIAKLCGARVFAVTSSGEKATRARELGADVVINRTETDFSREVWQLTGKRGVDVVLENVGAATWKSSLRAVAKGGRVITYGATAGPLGETDIRLVFWKQIHIIGSTMASQSEFQQVMKLVFRGALKPVVDRVLPIERFREAHEALEKGEQFGKIVLQVGD